MLAPCIVDQDAGWQIHNSSAKTERRCLASCVGGINATVLSMDETGPDAYFSNPTSTPSSNRNINRKIRVCVLDSANY